MAPADSRPPIALYPFEDGVVRRAIELGGGRPVALGKAATAVVWMHGHDAPALAAALRSSPKLEWVQLPSAGIDAVANAGILSDSIRWTSAKGAYARPVAEFTVALTLALLRLIHVRARATSWATSAGTTLYGKRVLIIGAGGIAEETARLLAPFEVEITVCRRHPVPVDFASRTITMSELPDQIGEADVVLIIAALTPETHGLFSADLFERMLPTAVLVNVARGGLVVTDDLVAALAAGTIAGAALDVTDPEPLPDGHPLWMEPRALITPHSANPQHLFDHFLAERVKANVSRFIAGEELLGIVDPALGY
jgi:phosphoglycerate dehydrogenase-like enzyme